MPWSNQGGGGGPWGGGGGQSPWGRGSGGRPPDLEDLLRRGQDRFKRALPGGFGSYKGIALVVIAALVIWLATGFYRVEPDEQGMALIFGRLVGTTQPGLNYNLPAPIGSVETPKVTRVNRVEIGFRSGFDANGSVNMRDVPSESLMLTGDENIIDIQFVVFWVIKDAQKYLFSIRHPDESVKSAAESAMREIIGKTPFEYARTQGRAAIEADAKQLTQHILDLYQSGIQVTQIEMQQIDPPGSVIEAFRDVQAARADKERAVNEAQAYYNEVTQKAEGQAEQVIKQAEAYKIEKVAIATGDAQRFLSVYDQYAKNKELTERRIYLETMENIWKGMDKVLVDSKLSNLVPYLPLDQMIKKGGGAATGTGAELGNGGGSSASGAVGVTP